MGLDMYLSAEKFLGGYSNPAGRDQILGAIPDRPALYDDAGSLTVSYEVAYWRKANAIHGWFVENVQDGEDNCEKHYVSLDSIKELLALVEAVLDGSAEPDDLPPQDGFFFGSTDDEDWYRAYLEDTQRQIKPLIDWFEADDKRKADWDLYYRSSW
jgi:hypothetical protein